MERSTCSNTCGTLEGKKVISGFTHTEYEADDGVVVEFMVEVSHKSYTDTADKFTWTSAKYHIKGNTYNFISYSFVNLFLLFAQFLSVYMFGITINICTISSNFTINTDLVYIWLFENLMVPMKTFGSLRHLFY